MNGNKRNTKGGGSKFSAIQARELELIPVIESD